MLSRIVWRLAIGSLLLLPPHAFILIMILTLNRVSRLLLHWFLLILCLSHLLQRATRSHRCTCRYSCRCSGSWCCRCFRRTAHAASFRCPACPGSILFLSASFGLHFADFDASCSVGGRNEREGLRRGSTRHVTRFVTVRVCHIT
ncbi:hypothetical protein P692DRAFT_2053897 [Suillus brevipes Sb2]|nr:hypothetical protein P692DRAFT_2053897 [Suillus brevipes Sb2]